LNVEVKEKEVIQEEDAIEGELDNGWTQPRATTLATSCNVLRS
jgi:hypothetical protein